MCHSKVWGQNIFMSSLLKRSLMYNRGKKRNLTTSLLSPLPVTAATMQLFHAVLGHKTLLMQLPEDLLGYPAWKGKHSNGLSCIEKWT